MKLKMVIILTADESSAIDKVLEDMKTWEDISVEKKIIKNILDENLTNKFLDKTFYNQFLMLLLML